MTPKKTESTLIRLRTSIFRFLMSDACLPKIIEFMNGWAREAPKIREL